MLTGRSHRGVAATAKVVAGLQARTTKAATDRVPAAGGHRPGGRRGPGPQRPRLLRHAHRAAPGQLEPARLRHHANTWASQLRAAGVNVNLAPVLGTVPSHAVARRNPPIGQLRREFGFKPLRVARHGVRVRRGHEQPRGGRDHQALPRSGSGAGEHRHDSTGVTDPVLRRGGPLLIPFRRAIRTAHARYVMMSTAYYPRMDAHHPAAFSPFIIDTVLRGGLHFGGVVVSDDLGDAAQVAQWTPGQRAVKFFRAGGDLALTVDASTLPAMYHAVLHRARHHAAFRRKVDRAALLVLQEKQHQHLLG